MDGKNPGDRASAADIELGPAWTPNAGPQRYMIECPLDEIFFGGSRGGGKTDGMLGKFLFKAQRFGGKCVGVFFRKTLVDLREAIERSKQIYPKVGAKFNETEKQWTLPNSARLKFGYLDRDDDTDNYQGHSYTDLFFEEIQHWPSPTAPDKLRATLRSASGIPCQFHATGNPGGVGAGWVKERYIDPCPSGFKTIWQEFKNPFNGHIERKSRTFIPSALKDNPYLGASYVAQLQQSGSPELVRAWLEGDWTAIEGAFFNEFSPRRHVLRPTTLPPWWARYRSADWGSAKPFAVHWWAVCGDEWQHPDGPTVPRGALVCYREWYGASKPNVGLKLTVESVARGIKDLEADDPPLAAAMSVIDPAAWNADGGPSIGERLSNCGIVFRRADNRRVGVAGAMGGWDMVRHRLVGDGELPMIFFFSTCNAIIRTLPALPHDKAKPEDVDTDTEDHAADSVRYACMARPWVKPPPVVIEDVFAKMQNERPTYDEFWRQRKRHA
ncbi:MAG: phage terminase large subunit [Rhodomicrobium sp.]